MNLCRFGVRCGRRSLDRPPPRSQRRMPRARRLRSAAASTRLNETVPREHLRNDCAGGSLTADRGDGTSCGERGYPRTEAHALRRQRREGRSAERDVRSATGDVGPVPGGSLLPRTPRATRPSPPAVSRAGRLSKRPWVEKKTRIVATVCAHCLSVGLTGRGGRKRSQPSASDRK
jgi:hypothetical protein